MNLNVTKAAARTTIRRLMAIHQSTLRDIEDGKRFYKGGVDNTDDLKKYVEHEIKQCQMVDDALDYMKAGELKKAAAICDRVTEFLNAN